MSSLATYSVDVQDQLPSVPPVTVATEQVDGDDDLPDASPVLTRGVGYSQNNN